MEDINYPLRVWPDKQLSCLCFYSYSPPPLPNIKRIIIYIFIRFINFARMENFCYRQNSVMFENFYLPFKVIHYLQYFLELFISFPIFFYHIFVNSSISFLKFWILISIIQLLYIHFTINWYSPTFISINYTHNSRNFAYKIINCTFNRNKKLTNIVVN